MGPNDGDRKPSLEVVSEIVSGMQKEQESNADNVASAEHWLPGKEIIKVAHRSSPSNDINNNHYLKLPPKSRNEETEVPEWIIKFYEKLIVELDSRTSLHVQNPIDEIIRQNKEKVNKEIKSQVRQLLELLNKMEDIFLRVQILVTSKSNGWIEKSLNLLGEIKKLMQTFENSIIVLDSETNLSKGSLLVDEIGYLLAINIKVKYIKFKQNLKVWADLSKVLLEGSGIFQTNDDIILAEEANKRNSAILHSESKDEL